MTPRILRLLLVLVCSVAVPQTMVAKGGHGGGGHGGGHGGGGHGGGGHGGGHAGGGHGGGHSSSGHAASRTTTPSVRHQRTGQPVVGTAVPRSTLPSTSPASPIPVGPTRISPSVGGFVSPWFYGPFFPGAFGFYDTTPAPIDCGEVATDPFGGNGPSGSLRLKIDPDLAQVFVDGYYAGSVHDFDGIFHRLKLQIGSHHVEVRAPEFETLAIDVFIQPHHTTVYRGALRRDK